MKRVRNYLVGVMIAVSSMSIISCDDTDDIVADPNGEFDVVLEVNEAVPGASNEEIIVNPVEEDEVKAKVTFATTSKDMKRLYITQNISGAGEEIYIPTESVDLKADKSIGLENSLKNNFEFQFDLPVPAGLGTSGTVVYKFWATTGNGDFRDATQRLAVGPGTITLKVGSGVNEEAEVKSFTDVKLFAPTADGLSKTFVSLLDGKTYDVKSGIEYAAFWDFGYIYRVGTDPLGAGFTSTFDYPTIAVDVSTVSGTPKDELNKSYFALSTKTSAQFDAITPAQLASISPNTVNSQSIGGLVVGSIIEFIDNYGKRGVIRVKQINGTNGSDGFIVVDIKIQP